MAAIRQAGGPYTGRGSFRFTWYGAIVAGQIDAAVQHALEETARAAKAEAQSRARVDTGEMREGIDAVVTTTGGGRRTMVLSGSANHTIYNELGTVHMSAAPMLRPAIDIEAPRLTQRLQAAMRGVR